MGRSLGRGFFCRPGPGPRGATISPKFKPIPETIGRRIGLRPSPKARCVSLRVCPAQQAAGKMLEQSVIGREEDDDSTNTPNHPEEDDDRSLANDVSTPEGAPHA